MTVSARIAAFVMLGMVAVTGASSQDRPVPPARATLYLVDISQAEQLPNFADLNKFATTFLSLRLARLPGMKIVRVPAEPPCDSDLSRTQQSKSQSTTTVDNQTDSIYVITGSIEVHRATAAAAQTLPAGNELVLNYNLSRRDRCQRTAILQRFENFTERNILDTLSVAGSLLVAKMATELKPRIDIQAVLLTSEGTDQTAIGDGLVDAVVGRLAFGNSFQPRDLRKEKPDAPAEYQLETRLDFKREKNPLNFFDGKVIGTLSGMEASFVVIATDGSSPALHRYQVASQVKGSISDRDKFYKAAAQAVAQGLEEIRVARENHLTAALEKLEKSAGSTLSTFESKVLLDQAEKLLCVGIADPCSVHPEAATPILTELAQRELGDQNREVFVLLGRSFYLNGQYLKAGQAFDQALSQPSGTPEENLALLNDAGDAWYKAQEYARAALCYSKSLEISGNPASNLPDNLRNQPEVQVQLARSLRFDGRQTDALRTLLDAVKTAANPAATMVVELKELIANTPVEELADSVKLLEAANDARLDQVRSLACERMAASFASKGDFPRATQFEEQARSLQDSEPAQYALALYAYLWTKSSHPGDSPPPPGYKRVAQLALPLVQKRYFLADSLLLQANHGLGADQETRAVFDSILAQKPNDISLLDRKMFLCNEFLKNLECAEEAAESIEKVSPQAGQSIALDIAEIKVLRGEHDDALRRIDKALADRNLPLRLRTVAHFYRTWVLLATNRDDDSRQAALQWKSDLTQVRSSRTELQWVFYGAESVLSQESAIPASKKALIADMMADMTDPTRPLPPDSR